MRYRLSYRQVIIITLVLLLIMIGVIWYYESIMNEIDHEIQQLKNSEI